MRVRGSIRMRYVTPIMMRIYMYILWFIEVFPFQVYEGTRELLLPI